LGSILYELVTGRAPFRSDSAIDILRQIQQEDPVRPKLLNARLPKDLETICLKCLEKEPRRRYASAQDLAEELGRFLRGEPIRARPIRRAARAWRWCKRKPVGAALLAALTAGTVGTTWQAVRATVAERAASVALDQVTAQKNLADRNAERATHEREIAVKNLNYALQTIDRVLTTIGSSTELLSSANEVFARQLLNGSKRICEELLAAGYSDPQLEIITAGLYERLAHIDAINRRHDEAIKGFQKAIALYERLAADDPHNALYRGSIFYSSLGLFGMSARLPPYAGDSDLRRAMDCQKWFVNNAKSYTPAPFQFQTARLAVCLCGSNSPETIPLANLVLRHFDEAPLEIHEHLGVLRALADMCYIIGLPAYESRQDAVTGEKYMRRAIEAKERAWSKSKSIDDLRSVINFELNLQNALKKQERSAEALQLIEHAQAHSRVVMTEREAEGGALLAFSYWDLGKLEWAADRREEAIRAWSSSFDQWKSNYRRFGPFATGNSHWGLVKAGLFLAQASEAVGRFDEALSVYHEVERQYRWNRLLLYECAATYEHAILLLRLNRKTEASSLLGDLETVLDAQKDADPFLWIAFLANCPIEDMRRPEEAVRLMRKYEKVRIPKLIRLAGIAEYRAGNYERCRELLRSMVEKENKNKFDFTSDYYFLAMAEARMGKRELALQTCAEARRYLSADDFQDVDRRCAELVLDEAARELNLPHDDPRVAPPWPTIHASYKTYQPSPEMKSSNEMSQFVATPRTTHSAFRDVVRLAKKNQVDEARKELLAVIEERENGHTFGPALNKDPLYPYVTELLGPWASDNIDAFTAVDDAHALPILERLVAVAPTTWLYWTKLGTTHYSLAEIEFAGGELEKSQQSQRAALAAYRRAQFLNPNSWLNNWRLSLFLANAAHEELRRPKEAQLLARSSDGEFSTTVTVYAKAIADYRSGQYSSAMESARTIRSPQADFTCAMSLWKLGDSSKAQQFYQRAATRLPKDPPPRIIRLRNEAAALLGIDPNNADPIRSQ
jgi:tetratricopeptide (TPR) repeat protein